MNSHSPSSDATGSQSLRRPLLRRLALAAFTTGMTVAVLELILPVMGIDYSMPDEMRDVYVPHQRYGTALEPGYEGEWTAEGYSRVRINSAGFRDREHALEKPPGVTRIAVIGDSFVEAFQVPQEQTFWARTQTLLADCPLLPNAEVLAFGVSGYGTAQELLLLRNSVWQFDPDVIVLAFFAANDVRNNARSLEPDRQRPFFDLQDGRLELDESFRSALPAQLAERARFDDSAWIRLKHVLVMNTQLGGLIYRLRHPEVTRASAGIDPAIYRVPENDAWQQAWRVTEQLLLEIDREVRQHDCRWLLLSIPQGVQVERDPDTCRQLARSFEVDDLDYPESRLKQFCEQHGIAMLSLIEPMRQAADSGPFHGFTNTQPGRGHLNDAGHAFVAELLSRRLCAAHAAAAPRAGR